MSLGEKVKSLLELSFDMPFDITEGVHGGEPSLVIVPSKSERELFVIHFRFFNGIRLEMTFEPQKYGAQMVREMGHSEEAQKRFFTSWVKQLQGEGAKVALYINDINYDPLNYDIWPDEWTKISIKVVIRPIVLGESEKPLYWETAERWLPLMMGLSLSLLNVVGTDDAGPQFLAEGENVHVFTEGNQYKSLVNRYERNPLNRILCLSKYGYTCQICGFDFQTKYGELGRAYINVHHIVPVSKMGKNYRVDPLTEMIPVCPNCHAMLHKQDPPLLPEELKRIITEDN